MRINQILFWSVGVMLLFVTPLSFTQEMKDQLFVIHEEVAKVDMIGQYEKTSTE